MHLIKYNPGDIMARHKCSSIFLGHSSVDGSVFIVCIAKCHVHVPLSVLQICLKTSFYFYSSRVSVKVLQ